MARLFRRHGDTRRNSRVLKEHNVLFDCLLWIIVAGEILHLQGSFQGAIGLDNCVRYRCNRPRLYLTEKNSIRWRFCLVNQNLLHLIWSASKNQSVRTHRRRNPTFEDQRKLTTCCRVQKCTEKTISKVIWVGKGTLDVILNQINKKFHFQWYRRHLNYQFPNYITDKVNGSRVQPSLFGEDQRPDPGDGGNRAYPCNRPGFVDAWLKVPGREPEWSWHNPLKTFLPPSQNKENQ